MGKTVHKLIIKAGWQTGLIESWLADMAGKGLHLKSLGQVFAEFERGEPKQTVYRADVLGPRLKEEQAEEQIARYQENGWKLIAQNWNYWIVSSEDKDRDTELYTDPVEQGKALSVWKKRVRNDLILEFAAILFFILISAKLFLMDTFILKMILEAKSLFILIAILYLFFFLLRDFILDFRLYRRFDAEMRFSHQEDWRRRCLTDRVVGAICLIILGLYGVMPIMEFDKRQDYPLPVTAVNLPALRLGEIEPDVGLQRNDSYVLQDEKEGKSNALYFGNEVSCRWSLLAPAQYDINEIATARNLGAEDSQSEYTPRVRTQYYRLTLPFLAESVMYNLMQKYTGGSETEGMVQEKENDFFEKLFLTQAGSQKQIFACRDGEVVYVSYDGNAEMEQIVALLPKVISEYDSNIWYNLKFI